MATTMSTILATLSSVFTAIIGLVPDVSAAITDNPILMLGLGLMFAGAIIGYFTRLLRST